MPIAKFSNQLLWFAAIWVASVVTLGLVAYVIKLLIL